jgi:hypothetical protein
MVMVFFHENLGFSQFSTCHPVSDLIRRTDVVGICRDLLAIDRRIRLLCDSPGLPLALDYPRGLRGQQQVRRRREVRPRLRAIYRVRSAPPQTSRTPT